MDITKVPYEHEFKKCSYCKMLFPKNKLYKGLCSTCLLDVSTMVEMGVY